MKSVRQKIASKGGKARARKMTPRRRREVARKAANARWERAAEAEGTLCRGEETAEGGTVVCVPCSLSWAMDDTNYPRCPRLADLKALPPITGDLEESARAIVHKLVHGGHREDFEAALPNRPDWQAYVGFVTGELLAACSRVG